LEAFLLERKPLSWSKFSQLLVATFVFATFAFLVQSRWSYLFSDRQNAEIIPIKTLTLVLEPVTSALLRSVQNGETPEEAISLEVFNRSLGEDGAAFEEQMKNLAPAFTKTLVENKASYLFYAEIPQDALKQLRNPRLVFYAINSGWNLYLDSNLLDADVSLRDVYFTYPIARSDTTPKRIIFVATPEMAHKDAFGLNDRYGLTLRSISETKFVSNWLINQRFYYYGIIALFFLFASLLILTLYTFQAPKEYLDVLAFGLLTGFLGLLVLGNLPIFYDAFTERGDTLNSIRLVTYLFVCLTMSYLSISFFRLETKRHIRVKSHLWIFSLIATLITAKYFPLFGGSWKVGAGVLSVITFLFNFYIFTVGISSLLSFKNHNEACGMPELNIPLPRRYLEIIFFAISLSLMSYFFGKGYFYRSTASGKDYWIGWSLVPTGVLLIQFQMMIGRAAHESKYLRSKLSKLEQLVKTATGTVFSKNWRVLIATYDVKGFSLMQFFESVSDPVREDLKNFVSSVGAYFDGFFSCYPQFHKKDGGDEWIFLLRPDGQTDQDYQDLFEKVFLKFRGEIDAQILVWKADLRARITGKLDDHVVDLIVRNFSLHASQVVVDDLRIDVGNGKSEKGDFKSPQYSLLKGIEKDASHWAVAMYQDQSAWVRSPQYSYVPKTTKIHSALSPLVAQGIVSRDKVPKVGLLQDINYLLDGDPVLDEMKVLPKIKNF
jgi:hypothetical protein